MLRPFAVTGAQRTPLTGEAGGLGAVFSQEEEKGANLLNCSRIEAVSEGSSAGRFGKNVRFEARSQQNGLPSVTSDFKM